ncbi:MAG: hypothetical protein U5N53_09470, partial [Mycobacterium sp.]|nr:hypothetical protein [Mycobacterium sp.]
MTIKADTGSLAAHMSDTSPAQTLPVGERVVYDFLKAKRGSVINKSTGVEWAKRRQEFMPTPLSGKVCLLWFKDNAAYSILVSAGHSPVGRHGVAGSAGPVLADWFGRCRDYRSHCCRNAWHQCWRNAVHFPALRRLAGIAIVFFNFGLHARGLY